MSGPSSPAPTSRTWREWVVCLSLATNLLGLSAVAADCNLPTPAALVSRSARSSCTASSRCSRRSPRFKDEAFVNFLQYQEHTDSYKDKQRFFQEGALCPVEVAEDSGFLSAVGPPRSPQEDIASGALSITALFEKAIHCLRLDLPSIPIGLCELFPNILHYRDSEQFCLMMYAIQFSCIPFVQYVMDQNFNTIRLLLQQIEEPILHFAIKNE